MRKFRVLVISILLVFTMACSCGLLSGIQDLQKVKNAASTDLPALQTAAATQLPALLTSAPTAQGMLETLAAQASSNTCTGTPTTGGLGVSVETAKTVLTMMQQFVFSDGIADGQPAVIAKLASSGATAYPAIADGFSAQFIGDPCNLSRITVTLPRSDQQDTVDQGMTVLNLVLTGTLPADVQMNFFGWLAQNYQSLTVGGKQQTTSGVMQFTLQRNPTSMILDVVPVK